jgi:hypothetical protein
MYVTNQLNIQMSQEYDEYDPRKSKARKSRSKKHSRSRKTGGAKKKRGSILVVEAKDGKIIKKYITKKQADKHMKPRHTRFDRLDNNVQLFHFIKA